MKIFPIIYFVLISIFFTVPAGAVSGDAKILLAGKAFNSEVSTRLTVKELESMFTLVTIEAYNPWEKKTDIYTGFWMNDLIKKLAKPELKVLKLKAIDNYQIEYKPQDWNKFRILIATQVNHQYQPVRNKGPIRLIYADYNPSDLEHELNLTKWMWMIKKIEFN